jgi:hypothetical protein
MKLVLFIVSLCIFNSVKSQEIQILSIDSSQYPSIKLKIAFKGKANFDSTQLKIDQKGSNLPFAVFDRNANSKSKNGRAVFLLVEATGNTSGKMLRTLKKGIIESLRNLNSKDQVNLAWFGSYELDSSNIQLLNRKFSSDLDKISDLINENVKSKKDSLRFSELNRSILSSFNYLQSQTKLPENKLFIVLSVDRNKSKLTNINSSECIDASKLNGIPIHSITYLANDSSYKSGEITEISDETGGKNIVAYSQSEIENALNELYDLSSYTVDEESQFEIVFNIMQDSSQTESKVEISYNGNRQIISIINPISKTQTTANYKKYLWYSIAILGIVVMIMLLINLFSRNGKQGKEEIESSIDQEETRGKEKKNTYTRPTSMLTEEKISAPIISKPAGPSVLLSLQGRTHPFVISKNETSIGRHDSNDIPIPEQTVTGKHAKIVMVDGKLTLVDLGSTNGTFVNGVRIRSHELKSGDRFRLGNVEMTLK